MKATIYTDASVYRIKSAYGFVILGTDGRRFEHGAKFKQHEGDIGKAELYAIINAVAFAKSKGYTEYDVKTDRLDVQKLISDYGKGKGRLSKWSKRVLKVIEQYKAILDKVNCIHVPAHDHDNGIDGQMNAVAHNLAYAAMKS